MSLNHSPWVFLPPSRRTPEQDALWWDKCFVSGSVDQVLQGPSLWRVIYGPPGSGKSVALASIERRSTDALILHYPPIYWPGARQVLSEGNHLSQIMTLLSLQVTRLLTAHPEKLNALSPFYDEYLRWLIQKFGRARSYTVWLNGLPTDLMQRFENIPYQDIYTTDSDPRDIQGQLQEAILLARGLGYWEILVFLDIDTPFVESQIIGLNELFIQSDMMELSGFAVNAAMSNRLVENAHLLSASKDRVKFNELEWSPEEFRAIVTSHVKVATKNHIKSLERLAAPSILDAMEQAIIKEHGKPLPHGAVTLARVLLDFAQDHAIPISQAEEPKLRHKYFQEHMQLQFDTQDKRLGVMRGQRFIPMDEQPFRMFRLFWYRRGQPATSDDEDVIEIATSKENLQMIVHRIRECIEPDPKNPLYLKSRRNWGYWLENCDFGKR